MHLGSLEFNQEARVALGCALSNSYHSLVLSNFPQNQLYVCVKRHGLVVRALDL